jgi:hypothetical protein
MSSERAWRLAPLRVILAAVAFALAVKPAEGEGFVGLYAAYWAGLPAAQVRISARESSERYSDRIDIRTVGLPWLFTRFRTTARARGRFADGGSAEPLRYDALFDLRRAKDRRITLRFLAKKGGFYAERGPGDTSDEGQMAEAFRRNALDPLSAFASIREALLRNGRSKQRSFIVPVYDGRRRFDVRGHIDPTSGKNGSPFEVTLTLSPIAGFKGRTARDIDPDNAPRPVLLKVTSDARLAPLSMRVSLYYLPLVVELVRFCRVSDGCAEGRVFP